MLLMGTDGCDDEVGWRDYSLFTDHPQHYYYHYYYYYYYHYPITITITITTTPLPLPLPKRMAITSPLSSAHCSPPPLVARRLLPVTCCLLQNIVIYSYRGDLGLCRVFDQFFLQTGTAGNSQEQLGDSWLH